MINEERIDKRYKLIKSIGRGGQSEIYLAIDQRLDREVAIKRSNLLLLSETDRRRFLREARILARTSHHHIISIYSLEEENDYLYIVMQYADLGSLRDCIAASPGGLPISEVVDIGIAMCKALAAVHAKGVIHRDVKPGNILLATEEDENKPVPKLADFGVARDMTATPLTSKGVLGTIPYMPPEAIRVREREEQIDERRDVYGLGAVLYQALTGCPPFGSEVRNILGHLGRAPTSPRAVRDDVPIWLEQAILKALAPNRADRYPNMHAMLTDLEEGKRLLEIEVARDLVDAIEMPGEEPPSPPVEQQPAAKSRLAQYLKNLNTQRIFDILDQTISNLAANFIWWLIGGIILILVSLFGFKLCTGPPPTTTTPTPSLIVTATASLAASPTHTATITPTLIPSLTPTPTTATSPTPTSAPTPSPTPTNAPPQPPTATVAPQAVPPELVAPLLGRTYKDFVTTFQWSGSLSTGQAYQVTAYHPEDGYTVQSALLTTQEWTTHLGDRVGEWRWRVSVVRGESELATSSEWVFWFNPFPSPTEQIHK